MKRVLRSWSCLADVVAAYLGWVGVTGLNAVGDSLVTLHASTVVPIGLAAGGCRPRLSPGLRLGDRSDLRDRGRDSPRLGARSAPDALLAAAIAHTGGAQVGLIAALGIAALGGKPPTKQG